MSQAFRDQIRNQCCSHSWDNFPGCPGVRILKQTHLHENFISPKSPSDLLCPLSSTWPGKQGSGVWKPGFHSSIISANLASVWVPNWGNKTTLYVVFCAWIQHNFVCGDPRWCCGKSSGMGGLGSSLPPCSTHHEGGNKPCQHGMKHWWWGWGHSGLYYLVQRRWGGDAGWFWCCSSALGEPGLAGGCVVPVPCHSSLPWVRCWVIQSNHFYIF